MRIKALVTAVWMGMLLAMAGWAQAVEVKNLYRTAIEVPDRSDESLRQGNQQALAEIVIRVSGDARALEAPDIQQAMAAPERYIDQFSFDRQVRMNPETGLPEPAFLLNVSFNSRGINQLVRRAGLPIWATNRAEVLLWLVIEDEQGRRLVTADSAPELTEILMTQAARRGLPLAFPINDLEDQLAVTAGDIWGLFMDPVVAASQRYAPGAVLVGKVYPPVDGNVRGAWAYRMDDNQQFLETKGELLDSVLAQAINFSADQLAAKYAVVLGEGDSDFIWLAIEGVATLTDFAELTAYLDKLVAVKQANLDRLQEANTRFRVYLESDVENLKQLLKLDKKLIELESVAAPVGVNLAVQGDQITIAGNGVMAPPPGEVLPVVEEPVAPPAVELRYHWYRTYVSEVSSP